MRTLFGLLLLAITTTVAMSVSAENPAANQTHDKTGWLVRTQSNNAQRSGQPTLDRIPLEINGHTLNTELAVTSEQRYKGLSFRPSLAADAAMLFVYKRERPLFFTMRDCSIPLSIAYLDEDLIIQEILDMTPHTDGPYPSSAPAKYALEVNQGWFRKNGIVAGDKVTMAIQ